MRVPTAVGRLGVVPCLNFGRKMMNRALVTPGARLGVGLVLQSVCRDAIAVVVLGIEGSRGAGIEGLTIKWIPRDCIGNVLEDELARGDWRSCGGEVLPSYG